MRRIIFEYVWPLDFLLTTFPLFLIQTILEGPRRKCTYGEEFEQHWKDWKDWKKRKKERKEKRERKTEKDWLSEVEVSMLEMSSYLLMGRFGLLCFQPQTTLTSQSVKPWLLLTTTVLPWIEIENKMEVKGLKSNLNHPAVSPIQMSVNTFLLRILLTFDYNLRKGFFCIQCWPCLAGTYFLQIIFSQLLLNYWKQIFSI